MAYWEPRFLSVCRWHENDDPYIPDFLLGEFLRVVPVVVQYGRRLALPPVAIVGMLIAILVILTDMVPCVACLQLPSVCAGALIAYLLDTLV